MIFQGNELMQILAPRLSPDSGVTDPDAEDESEEVAKRAFTAAASSESEEAEADSSQASRYRNINNASTVPSYL